MKEVFGKKSLNRDLLKQLLFSSSEQSKQLIKLRCSCCNELILRADAVLVPRRSSCWLQRCG